MSQEGNVRLIGLDWGRRFWPNHVRATSNSPRRWGRPFILREEVSEDSEAVNRIDLIRIGLTEAMKEKVCTSTNAPLQ